MKKRQQNRTALKVKYLNSTQRIKITQTNINKSIYISGADVYFTSVMDLMNDALNKIDFIDSFCLIVDNTQQKEYLFVVDYSEKYFPNYLLDLKKYFDNLKK